MKSIILNTKFLLLALLVFFSGLIAEKVALNKPNYRNDLKKVQKFVNNRELAVTALLENIPEDIIISEDYNVYQEYFNEHIKNSKNTNVFIFKKENLIFWTNHTVPIKNKLDSLSAGITVLHLDDAWYLKRTKVFMVYTVHGLVRIKNEYPYENRFLENGFAKPFQLNHEYELLSNEHRGLAIKDLSGDFLFSIEPISQYGYSQKKHGLLGALYGLSMILFLIFLHQFIHFAWFRWSRKLKFIIVINVLVSMRAVMLFFDFPAEVYQFSIFDPKLFAVSPLLPSLGDLLIHSIFIFFLVFEFFSAYSFHERGKITQKIQLILLISLLTVLYLYSHHTFESLIYNSSISFEAYRVLNLSVYSFIGVFILGLNFISLVLFTEKIIESIKAKINFNLLVLILVLSSLFIFALSYLLGTKFDFLALLFFYAICFIVFFAGYKKKKLYNFNGISILVIVFTLYSVYFINTNAEKKEKNKREVLAKKIASQHDPVAEVLLPGIEEKIKGDTLVKKILLSENIESDELINYISKKYFGGFLSKYSLQTILCNPTDTIYIEPPDDAFAHCYGFFEQLIRDQCIRLENSNFFFIDNLNGNISYFGAIEFIKDLNSLPITLFIQLDSKLLTKELGYPELLLDKTLNNESVLDDYSYAKYVNDELISKSGDYKYGLTQNYIETDSLSLEFVADGYSHLFYQIGNNNSIIISRPTLTFFNLLISFSYIFLFFYFLGIITLMIIRNPLRKGWLRFNFKERIQFSMVAILLLSLPVLGGGTIYFSILQYKSKHNQIVAEKIQSVYIELVHKLEYEEELTPEWKTDKYDNLNQLLIKFSNVFYTDINLYDENGNLLATSRPEVFNTGLIGKKMNIEAYTELSVSGRPEFIHEEHIGKLKYISGYVPFFNADNKLLAYLNLPYFTNQSTLTNEIYGLVVAIVNIYVLLLILTLTLAFFISNRLTQPLKFIQNKIKEIDLGKSNLKINYKRNDELGSLVAEYNAKVEELNDNVELLAKSERESAWREMAKQIAHEIKNPLTPMKLNVQHLFRTLKGKEPEIDERLERYTKTLIEQIDQLSSIATEFSNFAKMPKAKNEKFDLVSKLHNVVNLFSSEENLKIEFQDNDIKELFVFADKEQLLRAFVNLIKNGIQSVPEQKTPEITIQLNHTNSVTTVEIIDNGTGIPEELRGKLFQPNFTTKTSGMGLGLAIVKKTIEDCNGSIYFETAINKGTKFVIELPVFLENKENEI